MKLKQWLAAICIISTAMVIRLKLAVGTDVPRLLSLGLPDDAMYYIQVARNIVLGQGATFDGLHPTNGYHALWLFILLPPQAIVRGLSGEIPLRLTLVLEVVLDTAALWYLFKLIRSASNSFVAASTGVFLFGLNAMVVVEGVNGLETGLNLLMLVLCADRYLQIVTRQESELRSWTRLGVLLGLLVLARTDNVVVVSSLCFGLFGSKPRPQLRHWATLLIPLVLVTVPWFAWNWIGFGSPLQVSGSAYAYVLYHNALAGSQPPLVALWTQTRTAALFALKMWGAATLNTPGGWHELSARVLAFIEVVAIGCLTSLAWCRRQIVLKGLRPFAALGLGIVGQFLVNGVVRWDVREWYYVPPLAASLVLVAIATGAAWQGAQSQLAKRVAFSTSLTVVVLVWMSQTMLFLCGTGFYPWHIELYEAALWVHTNTDPSERIGSFNAGTLSYFSDRTVVNLDGVINNSAHAAILRGRLAEYARTERIRYVVDFGNSVEGVFGTFWGPYESDQPTLVRVLSRPDSPAWNDTHVGLYYLEPEGGACNQQ